MPSTYEALLCVAFGIAPGYLFYSALRSVVIRETRSSTALVVESIVGSMVYWAIAGSVVYAVPALTLDSNATLAWLGAGAVLLPILAGVAVGKVDHVGGLRKSLGVRDATPLAWDFRFGKGEPLWALITLTDGSRVGGLWGADSFASSYPNPEDVYLEIVYHLEENGSFGKPFYQSAGVWVPGDSIKCIEFFSLECARDGTKEELKLDAPE